jgi:hypothetical protein
MNYFSNGKEETKGISCHGCQCHGVHSFESSSMTCNSFLVNFQLNCSSFLIQASKFYENPSYVSCFLAGTLPCVYHSKKNP